MVWFEKGFSICALAHRALARKLMGQDRFPDGPQAFFFHSVSEWKKELNRVKKLKTFSPCHGGVVIKAVMLKA